MMTWMEQILLMDLMIAAVVQDFRMGLISNELILTGLLCAPVRPVLSGESALLIFRMLGALLPLLFLYPLFSFRMLGAGDIKLLAVSGIFLGFPAGLKALTTSFFIGGVLAAGLILHRRNLFSRVQYFLTYLSHYRKTRERKPYIREGDQSGGTFHFALPIALGTFLVLLTL